MRRFQVIEDPDAECVKIPRCDLLDAPTEPHPLLDALMDRALFALKLRSDGACASLAEKVSTGKSRSHSAPLSGLGEDLYRLESAYLTSRTHRRRLDVIRAAQAEDRATMFAPRENQRDTPEWRAAVAADARPYRVIAVQYGISASTVGNIKRSCVQRLAQDASPCNYSLTA